MSYYVTYGKFQQHMKDYYLSTGSRLQFIEMTNYLVQKGLLEDSYDEQKIINIYEDISDMELNKIIDSMILKLSPNTNIQFKVHETDIIPTARDVFIIRHLRYTKHVPHSHNYFEINYVSTGSCDFTFEENTIKMKEGELCIIAPGSKHDIVINDDSTVFTIMIRRSTFDITFFSLLSRKDLLSYFFRSILQDDSHTNYLIFFTENNKWIKRAIRNLMAECSLSDEFSNSSCINIVNLLFSSLLRYHKKTIQFYNYQVGTDLSMVLQYIQQNYKSISLSSLAAKFHYSEPHLCTLIKQHTNYTFTELIRNLRMTLAVDCLTNTDMKISEIAEHIGYNSPDHFSRTFQSVYKVSPQKFRKINLDSENKYLFIE